MNLSPERAKQIREQYFRRQLYGDAVLQSDRSAGEITIVQTSRHALDLRSTAWHEAGHALLFHLEGTGIDVVSIKPTDECLGRVIVDRTTDEHAELAGDLGGPVAQAIYNGSYPEIVLRASDRVNTLIAARRYGRFYDCATDDDILNSSVFKDAVKRAHDTILENKSKVEALVAALMERRELSGAEVRAIVGTASRTATATATATRTSSGDREMSAAEGRAVLERARQHQEQSGILREFRSQHKNSQSPILVGNYNG